MVAMFYFSSQSQPLPELTTRVWDKALHTIEYAGLGFLVFRALSGEKLVCWSAALLTVVIVSGYGASDEWHQLYVPTRSGDVLDWLVDVLGGGLGTVAYLMISTASRPPRPLRR